MYVRLVNHPPDRYGWAQRVVVARSNIRDQCRRIPRAQAGRCGDCDIPAMHAVSNNPSPVPAPLRQLSWSYQRGRERQHCILSMDVGRCVYEFRIAAGEVGTIVRLERFRHASKAITRQCEYEAHMLAAGFSLDDFQARSIG